MARANKGSSRGLPPHPLQGSSKRLPGYLSLLKIPSGLCNLGFTSPRRHIPHSTPELLTSVPKRSPRCPSSESTSCAMAPSEANPAVPNPSCRVPHPREGSLGGRLSVRTMPDGFLGRGRYDDLGPQARRGVEANPSGLGRISRSPPSGVSPQRRINRTPMIPSDPNQRSKMMFRDRLKTSRCLADARRRTSTRG